MSFDDVVALDTQARYSENITMATMGLLLSIIPTSPIRRYPDLMVHPDGARIRKNPKWQAPLDRILPDIASQSSSPGTPSY